MRSANPTSARWPPAIPSTSRCSRTPTGTSPAPSRKCASTRRHEQRRHVRHRRARRQRRRTTAARHDRECNDRDRVVEERAGRAGGRAAIPPAVLRHACTSREARAPPARAPAASPWGQTQARRARRSRAAAADACSCRARTARSGGPGDDRADDPNPSRGDAAFRHPRGGRQRRDRGFVGQHGGARAGARGPLLRRSAPARPVRRWVAYDERRVGGEATAPRSMRSARSRWSRSTTST